MHQNPLEREHWPMNWRDFLIGSIAGGCLFSGIGATIGYLYALRPRTKSKLQRVIAKYLGQPLKPGQCLGGSFSIWLDEDKGDDKDDDDEDDDDDGDGTGGRFHKNRMFGAPK